MTDTAKPKRKVDLSVTHVSVLALVMLGLSNKEVARSLGTSPLTVKNHVAEIIRRLGAKTRTGAVYVGLQRGLIRVEAA